MIKKETVYIPVHENDKDMVGDYISHDGRSMCRVKEVEMYVMPISDANKIITALKFYADSDNYTAEKANGDKCGNRLNKMFNNHQILATAYDNKKIEVKAAEILDLFGIK